MGEFIAARAKQLARNDWVLVGHGDWSHGVPEPNPREPGVYMPLTQIDIESYKPSLIFLGHIHRPTDKSQLYYPGSPCGLAINETGRRRFLIMDLESRTAQSRTVGTRFIYFNESLVILPVEDETEYVKDQLSAMIENWDLHPDEVPKARIQFKVRGYTSNKRALLRVIQERLASFTFYQDQGPDLSAVAVADDLNRAEIASRVSRRIRTLDWDTDCGQPDRDEILLEALHVIYGD